MSFTASLSRLTEKEDGKSFATIGDHTDHQRVVVRTTAEAIVPSLRQIRRALREAMKSLPKGSTLTMSVSFHQNPPK